MRCVFLCHVSNCAHFSREYSNGWKETSLNWRLVTFAWYYTIIFEPQQQVFGLVICVWFCGRTQACLSCWNQQAPPESDALPSIHPIHQFTFQIIRTYDARIVIVTICTKYRGRRMFGTSLACRHVVQNGEWWWFDHTTATYVHTSLCVPKRICMQQLYIEI